MAAGAPGWVSVSPRWRAQRLKQILMRPNIFRTSGKTAQRKLPIKRAASPAASCGIKWIAVTPVDELRIERLLVDGDAPPPTA